MCVSVCEYVPTLILHGDYFQHRPEEVDTVDPWSPVSELLNNHLHNWHTAASKCKLE